MAMRWHFSGQCHCGRQWQERTGRSVTRWRVREGGNTEDIYPPEERMGGRAEGYERMRDNMELGCFRAQDPEQRPAAGMGRHMFARCREDLPGGVLSVQNGSRDEAVSLLSPGVPPPGRGGEDRSERRVEQVAGRAFPPVSF